MDTKQDHRISVDRLIPLVDIKKALAISWPMMIELVRDGTLPTYSVSSRPVRRDEIGERTRGLRVLKSDLEAYIQSIKVQ